MKNVVAGLENINPQKEQIVLSKLSEEFMSMFDIVRLQLDDLAGTNYDANKAYESYDKYKHMLKSSMIDKHLENINSLLLQRFGVGIVVSNSFSGVNKIANVVMPPLNYKIINLAINDINSLFPKKKAKGILWETIASDKEKNMYNTLNEVKRALQGDGIELDFDNATVKGLEHTAFMINIDVLTMTILNFNVDEAIAILFHEIGHIFTYLEYMTSTSKNTLTLVDSFINERFTKNKEPLESLKIAIAKTDTDVEFNTSTPAAMMESLDMFILKTYRLNNKKGSIKIDFERLADQFTTRFGLGSQLSSALVKIASLGTINPDEATYKDNSSFMLSALKVIVSIGIFVISVLLFNIIGLIIMAAIMIGKVFTMFLGFILSFIKKVFSVLFSSDVSKDIKYDELTKRLSKIRLELVRELRTYEYNDYSKQAIITQIDSVSNTIKQVKGSFSVIARYDDNFSNDNKYDNYETIDNYIETLSENDLHLLGSKFDLIK